LLAARLDRPLTRAENRILVAHLKTCAACRQVERDYRDQSALLRSLPTPQPPRDMWARTSTALDREMSRRGFGYPRVGRRRVVRAAKSAGAPSALATVVAALGVVMALVALQLVPSPPPAATSEALGGSAVALRPTPFAIKPEPLALLRTDESDMTLWETSVDRVCPQVAPDCLGERKFVERRLSIPSLSKLQNATLSGDGRMAFVGHGRDRDVIAVVLLPTDVTPPGRPSRTPTEEPSDPATPRTTATQSSVVSTEPSTSPSSDASGEPMSTSTPKQTPDDEPSASPTVEPDPTQTPGRPSDPPPATPEASPSPEVQETPTPQEVVTPVVPHGSAVPGTTVLAILEDVHSSGSPPSWSRNGEVLAFSATPADGSHGPDVYVWQPGDAEARPITNDHSSFFASWSGRRIVISRVSGEADTREVGTVVIDPQTLEERSVAGPQMWLPVVDPLRSRAVAWQGTLDFASASPELVEGALYVVDWTQLNPFRADDGDVVPTDSTDVELMPLHPERDPIQEPVQDWNARWSTDGLILGVWTAEAPTESWGNLELLGMDPGSGALNTEHPLLAQVAKRGFALGSDRVAWIAPSAAGVNGELRIRTWGIDGVGDLRIQSLEQEELVPTF
jgi:hypothetical protein